MPLYRLRAGQQHYKRLPGTKQARKGLELMKPGEEIELLPDQATALADKFELVGSTQAEREAKGVLQKEAEETAHELVEVEQEDGLSPLYNVVNKDTGVIINDEPLDWNEAKLLTEV